MVEASGITGHLQKISAAIGGPPSIPPLDIFTGVNDYGNSSVVIAKGGYHHITKYGIFLFIFNGLPVYL